MKYNYTYNERRKSVISEYIKQLDNLQPTLHIVLIWDTNHRTANMNTLIDRARVFLKRLERELVSGHWMRKDKHLPFMAFVEHHEDGTLHIHLLMNPRDKTIDDINKASRAIKLAPDDIYPLRPFYIDTILDDEPDPAARHPRKRQRLYNYVMKEIRYDESGEIDTSGVTTSEKLLGISNYKNKPKKKPKGYAKYNIKVHNRPFENLPQPRP